jgi:hypothetical protein
MYMGQNSYSLTPTTYYDVCIVKKSAKWKKHTGSTTKKAPYFQDAVSSEIQHKNKVLLLISGETLKFF